MKKKTKKLVLAKETVRSLEEVALEKIEGGASICSTCYTWMTCPNKPNIYD